MKKAELIILPSFASSYQMLAACFRSPRVLAATRAGGVFAPTARSLSHFAGVPLAPPDPIIGLNDAFKCE